MDKQQLLQKLAFLSNADQEIGLVMFLIVQTDNGLEKRKAQIADDVRTELKEQFIGYIERKFIENQELHFTNVTDADNRKNVAYFYDLDETPNGLEVMGELLTDEEMPIFDFGADNFDDVIGYVFLLGNENDKIAIYKKLYPISLIHQASILMLMKDDVQLVKVNRDVIKINDSFEFMQIEDDLIVTNLKTLERFFGFEDVIRNKATANLTIIEQSNLIEDITPLNELASDLRFARKLMKVKSDSAVLQLSIDKVKGFILNHPKLKRRIRFNAVSSKIELDTHVSKELFLKLLDDDFLKSDLTDFLYESDIKNKMSNEEEND
ncbi:MAG: DUF4868 domain-containing protein [Lewinellaceae bacterium]|nr:DUF4868 domain-containing protein [Lewinellaceae bacterium]